MKFVSRLLLVGMLFLGGVAKAQLVVYDASTSTLTIPAIRVGSASYSNITLRPTNTGSFAITGAVAGSSEPSITNDLSLTTGIMTLPRLRIDVGGSALYYKNVTLLIRPGTLEFDLTGGQPDSVVTPGTGGNSTLTIQITLTGASIPGFSGSSVPPATVNNVPKPASQSEFCNAAGSASGSQSLSAAFTQAGVAGSFSIDACSFNGSVGTVDATLRINTGFFNVDLKYRAVYTYN